VLGLGGMPQRSALWRGDRLEKKLASVGAAVGDGPGQREGRRISHARGAHPDPAQQQRVLRVGQHRGVGYAPSPGHRQAQVEHDCSAGQPQLPVVRIDDREPPRGVGPHLKGTLGHPEAPGLGVVRGGRQARRTQHVKHLLGGHARHRGLFGLLAPGYVPCDSPPGNSPPRSARAR
jgi:hypothetical protein